MGSIRAREAGGGVACAARERVAHWLLGAGQTDTAQPPRSPDPQPYLVYLEGARDKVSVISPPGSLDGLRPVWQRTTELGADPATFANLA